MLNGTYERYCILFLLFVAFVDITETFLDIDSLLAPRTILNVID